MKAAATNTQLKCRTCGREVGILRTLMQHDYCCDAHRQALPEQSAAPSEIKANGHTKAGQPAVDAPPAAGAVRRRRERASARPPAEDIPEPCRRLASLPSSEHTVLTGFQLEARNPGDRFLARAVTGALPAAPPLPLRFQLQTFPRVPVILDELRFENAGAPADARG